MTTKLSNYFEAIAAKKITAVEANGQNSNQHEFNSTKDLQQIFGSEKVILSATYIYFGDDEYNITNSEGKITWYNSREKQTNRSAEFRLYYTSNPVTNNFSAGDLLVVAKRKNNSVLIIIAKSGSSYERQVKCLFNLKELGSYFKIDFIEFPNKEIGFAERIILEQIGIEVDLVEHKYLDQIIENFGYEFPSTKLFSSFARDVSGIIDMENPDSTIMTWINQEEILFRTLEKYLVEKRLKNGFKNVDDFVEYSLRIHNRRKSRIGFSLENHLEEIFIRKNIKYSRNKITENKSKPDFIFPTINFYKSTRSQNKLTLLAVKSTCKERWRQIPSEGVKIKIKHLFTLEPSISLNQTEQMKSFKIKLVIPAEIHNSYLSQQRKEIMNLNEFIKLIKKKELIGN